MTDAFALEILQCDRERLARELDADVCLVHDYARAAALVRSGEADGLGIYRQSLRALARMRLEQEGCERG